ncbi:MAG: hypothetical protein GY874_16490 [Desulfobacteraceae bacterium]|nr:hypothetical protein [Desulfobacteraceae bacterium]
MSIRVIEFLKKKYVCFEMVRYNHDEKSAKFTSQTLCYPLHRVIKTLVPSLDGGTHAFGAYCKRAPNAI